MRACAGLAPENHMLLEHRLASEIDARTAVSSDRYPYLIYKYLFCVFFFCLESLLGLCAVRFGLGLCVCVCVTCAAFCCPVVYLFGWVHVLLPKGCRPAEQGGSFSHGFAGRTHPLFLASTRQGRAAFKAGSLSAPLRRPFFFFFFLILFSHARAWATTQPVHTRSPLSPFYFGRTPALAVSARVTHNGDHDAGVS